MANDLSSSNQPVSASQVQQVIASCPYWALHLGLSLERERVNIALLRNDQLINERCIVCWVRSFLLVQLGLFYHLFPKLGPSITHCFLYLPISLDLLLFFIFWQKQAASSSATSNAGDSTSSSVANAKTAADTPTMKRRLQVEKLTNSTNAPSAAPNTPPPTPNLVPTLSPVDITETNTPSAGPNTNSPVTVALGETEEPTPFLQTRAPVDLNTPTPSGVGGVTPSPSVQLVTAPVVPVVGTDDDAVDDDADDDATDDGATDDDAEADDDT